MASPLTISQPALNIFQNPTPPDSPPQPQSTEQSPTEMASPGRPKLSLNTTIPDATPRSFGKGSTSLRLDTMSAISPTRMNTVRNSFGIKEPTVPAAVAKPALPSLQQPSNNKRKLPALRLSTEQPAQIPPAPIDTATEPYSEFFTAPTSPLVRPFAIPYTQPANLRSILSNRPSCDIASPNCRLKRRLSSAITPSPSPPTATKSRPKRVCFRQPLDETIHTSTFTMRHSDIPSAPSSPVTDPTDASEEGSEEEGQDDPSSQRSRLPTPPREAGDDHYSNLPKTPTEGLALIGRGKMRKKKEREWVWTLGELPRSQAGVQSEQLSPAAAGS